MPTVTKPRGYSKAFPSDRATAKRYLLDTIPADLWAAARARAKRDRISMRALILQLLTDHLDRRARS